MLPALLTYYVVVLGVLIYASYPTKLEPHRLLFKALTSAGFIALAVYCALDSGNIWFLGWMLPPLGACFVGDVLMAVTDNHWNDGIFTAGVAAFAVAHLLFLVAISQLSPFNPWELAIPACVAGGMLFVGRIPGLDVGKLKGALVPYGFLVAWLFSKTLVWTISCGGIALSWTMMVGALLFMVSDVLLLIIYFYNRTFKPMRFLNQATYYGGMALLALSILLV